MAGPAQGEQGDGGRFAVFSSYLKRQKSKKRKYTQNFEGQLPQPETLPAHVAVSPPAASREPSAAIRNEPLGSLYPDLWSRAYQSLDEKTRKWIDNVSADESGDERTQDLLTKHLVKVVKEREEEYKNATPKLKVGGFEIQWKDYTDRVVIWVPAICNITMNFAPKPSPVIWSAL